MNRYAAAGIRADALAGKHVLVLTHDDREACAIVDMRALNDGAARVIRHQSGTRVVFADGGEIRVRSHRAVTFGLDFDLVYLVSFGSATSTRRLPRCPSMPDARCVRRSGVAVVAAVTALLSACASGGGADGSDAGAGGAGTAAPPALRADIVQGRGDVRDGIVGIVVTNDSDAEIVVDHAEYRSSALVEPLVGGDGTAIPAGASRALRGELPTPACDGAPVVDEVVVVLDGGTEVRVDPGDPYDQLATLTDAPCTRLAVESVVDVEWLPVEVPEPALGADATVSLLLTPTGGGALEVQSVESTVLLALVDAAGARTTTVPIDVTVAPDGGAQTVAFTVRPGRCDAHAIAEDKQGTIVVFQVVLDGVQRTWQLPSDDATRGALLDYVAASCGLG